MKCSVPEISWHNRDPVLSVDIHCSAISPGKYRLASGGNDSHVVVWQVTVTDGDAEVEVLADLTHHLKPVNVVRFAPTQEILLASADDDGHIILWRRQDHADIMLGSDGVDFREHYSIHKTLRGHLQDVYDVCWSADGSCLISGAVDNTAILWDVQKGVKMKILDSHESFVQGVAWDPLNKVVATLSCDRHCRIFNVQSGKCISKVQKLKMPCKKEDGTTEEKACRLFHDDTLQTFCRRLTFTPDGTLLLAPAGFLESATDPAKRENVVHVFSRHDFSRPVFCLPSGDKCTIAVRCCPLLFKLRMRHPPEPGKPLWEQTHSLLKLPYRMVMAVATRCAVLLYDTQQEAPFARISNIHFTRLTDLSWSRDGRLLMVSSTDGFCSVITFEAGELGDVYQADDERPAKVDSNGTAAAQQPQPPAQSPTESQAEPQEARTKPQPPPPQEQKPTQPPPQKPTQQQQKPPQPQQQQKPPQPAADAPRTPSRRVPLVTLSSPRQPAARTSPGPPAAADVSEDEEAGVEPMDAADDDAGLVLYLEETTRELDDGPGSPAAAEPPPPPSPRTPRRVPLVTLSSPKRSPKPRTPAKTDG